MTSETVFDQIGSILEQAGTRNAPWRFIAATAILVAGFILLEILFRWGRSRLQRTVERKGLSPDAWDLSPLLPPFRLAATALLLRTAHAILILPHQLQLVLSGIEAFAWAIAAILALFLAIGRIDRLAESLPERLREGFPESTVSKLKSALRVSVLIMVAAGYIYTQRSLFPEWLWKYAWWRYLLVVVIINMVLLLIRLSEKFLSGMLLDMKDAAEKVRTRLVLESTVWPIRLLLATLAVYAVKEILPLPGAVVNMADGTIGLLTTLAVVIFAYRMVDLIAHELNRIAQRPDNLMDQTFVQMIRVFSRLIVVVVGAIYIIRALTGKPMSTLLAGLGIGGLAVALAAQDTLKNFFGSIMIMLDKPFDVGQRVVLDGVDGIVESIGFRSTRVRTLTGHMVTVPNEKMATSMVENIGRRPSIRRLSNITITYDTPPDKVQLAVEIIRGILDNHEGMHRDFPPRVYFNEFNDTSLNILMIYWYHPPNYWDYVAFSERVNLRIMRAFEAEGIEFAFPTTTTYLAHDPRRPLHIRFSEDSGLAQDTTPPGGPLAGPDPLP